MKQIEDEIAIHNEAYNFLVDCAEYCYGVSNIDKALSFCQQAASYATFIYCGFYTDARLEELLLKIGRKYISIVSTNTSHKDNSLKKKILHYATSIYSVGGHTRLIENWIKNDVNNVHDIVLTLQNEVIPDFIVDALDLVKGRVINIENNSIVEKSIELYRIANEYDLIILHHHANDIIPVLSFSVNMYSPVCVLNHGDHRYWLGASICDTLIEIRENLIEVDRLRRVISKFSLLPIPIKSRDLNEDQYKLARRKLGVSEDEIMLLSIGSSYKYTPIDERNFFKDVLIVLDNKSVKLFVVGIKPDEHVALEYKHDNLFFIAPTPYLDDYKNACDIYLEGYPFSSFTAYLEVAVLGKPVHRMYNPPLLNEYKIFDYPHEINYSSSKENWISTLEGIISDKEKILYLGKVEKNNSVIHSEISWKKYLNLFYKETELIHHEIRDIKNDNHLLISDNDIYLYKMQVDNKINYHLSNFYILPLPLKIKLIYSRFLINICGSKVTIKDAIWFLFKSHKYA